MLGILLAIIGAIQFAWSIGVALYPEQVDNMEAVVHDQAARILRGEPLYQPLDRPPYTVAAYTPIYYWLAGALQAILGPGLGPGRALSLLGSLTTAGLVGYLAAQRAPDRRAGLFAAGLFFALGLPGFFLWSALYRVDLLGIAFAVGAICVLAGGSSPHRVMLAGVLAALAILTKQTLLAAGLAGLIWLWRRDRGAAALFAGTGLVMVLGACLILELTTGAFVQNTISANVNPFSLDVLAINLVALAWFQVGPLAVATLYLLDCTRAGRRVADDLLGLYWFASLLPLVGLAKVGSTQNYWIEFAAATAVLATLGVWSQHKQYVVVRLGLLGMSVALAAATVAVSVPATFSGFQSGPERAARFGKLIERVRSEPAEVVADPADVVTLAGRRNLVEPFIFSILHHQGQWEVGPLVDQICAGEIGLVVLGYRLETPPPRFGAAPHWPPPVLVALRETMVLEAEQAGRFIYVPDRGSSRSGCRAPTS